MTGLDRDAARKVFDRWGYESTHLDALLDKLDGCVRPAPAQTIDRDAAIRAVEQAIHATLLGDLDDDGDLRVAVKTVDAVLALLRSKDGVTLTRDEAACVYR